MSLPSASDLLKKQLESIRVAPNQDQLNRTLIQAIRKSGGSKEVVATLKLGANPNWNHSTALRLAIMEGHLRIVQALVKYGADIHGHNMQAMRVAVLNDQLPIAQYLLAQGASVESGRTWLSSDSSDKMREWMTVQAEREALQKVVQEIPPPCGKKNPKKRL